ncbi:MAG: TlpA family protein disulfide reductase [Lewinellaceae bacterium]|nr:TlpA family protein disulfide reductase [Lewinellaceae bacterium]
MVGYWVILLGLLASCQDQAPLSGKLVLPAKGEWSSTIYLLQPRSLDEVATSYTGQVIDSARINSDGSFAFNHLPDAADPLLLELAVQRTGERFANRLDNESPLTANYMPIVWENGLTLKISASIDRFQSSFAIENPSPANAALLHLRDIRQQAFQQFLASPATEDHDETQLLEAEAARLNFQQPLIDFAQNTSELLPALVAIRWVSPNNDYERIPEFLVAQCQQWQNSHPNHPWVAQLCQKSDRALLPVLQGDQLPDAALPMLGGDTLALAQLIQGNKLTVLDLWASWCAPCRRENRDYLVPLWEKYHTQGFEIIGYALDASDKAWKRAIETDGAYRWLHASHLRGDDAPLLEVLRIQTIPSNFILDANGKVIAKNVHGEDLVAFVTAYFQ